MVKKGKLVVLSGAGMSAESGIQTFRGNGGLWEGHRIEDVASPEGWQKDKQLVLDFYNKRRRQLSEVKPNLGHEFFADLEEDWTVQIITQNVDDLHERAGSSNVLHLHGELLKACSENNHQLIVDQKKDINIGDLASDGHQLRPAIVWFGEAVPNIEYAVRYVEEAEVIIIIGTSLLVYPAAGLITYAQLGCHVIYVDPNPAAEIHALRRQVKIINKTATNAIPEIKDYLANI